jgi:hypothetical protein
MATLVFDCFSRLDGFAGAAGGPACFGLDGLQSLEYGPTVRGTSV